MDTDSWEAAGLYQPDSAGAGERRALLEHLVSRGATLEEMVEAHQLGGLPALAGYLVRGRPPDLRSVAELAAQSGVPVERLRRVLLAAGLPVAADTELSEDLELLMSAFEAGAGLMGEEAVLAFSRVLGAAATNIAEAAVALFYAEAGPGTEREGADELERAVTSERATLAFLTVPDAFSELLLAHFGRATRRALLARSWSEGDRSPEDPPGPTEVVALGFVDLVGSTR